MSERTIVVARGEAKTAKNGNPYIIITDEDDKRYTVFDKTKFAMIKNGCKLKLIGEETDKGFNVEDIEFLATAERLIEPKGSWGHRGKSIEELELSRRSYALSYVKDLACAGKVDFNQILTWAEKFHQWLLSGKDTDDQESKQSPEQSEDKTGDSPTKSQLDTMKQLKQEKELNWLMIIKTKHPDWVVPKDIKGLTKHQAEVLILEQTATEQIEEGQDAD